MEMIKNSSSHLTLSMEARLLAVTGLLEVFSESGKMMRKNSQDIRSRTKLRREQFSMGPDLASSTIIQIWIPQRNSPISREDGQYLEKIFLLNLKEISSLPEISELLKTILNTESACNDIFFFNKKTYELITLMFYQNNLNSHTGNRIINFSYFLEIIGLTKVTP